MRSPDGPVWEFDAGALCLELLLSGGDGDLARWERLHDVAGLAAWLPSTSLGAAAYDVTDEDVATTRTLRRAIQALADAAAAGSRARDADRAAIDVVNAVAAGAPPVPALGPGGAAVVSPVTGAQAAVAFARDAVALFGGPARDRVRRCSAADCPLLFADTSRPGTRRWCSMQRCGNRAKQRARAR